MSAKNTSDYYAGRPTNYKPEYCGDLLDHMKDGRSFWTFGATLYELTSGEVRAPKSVLKDWLDNHEEFRAAKEIGETLAQNYLEEAGLTAMHAPANQFNTGVWIFTMKNRCNWADKVETKTPEAQEKPGFVVGPDASDKPAT